MILINSVGRLRRPVYRPSLKYTRGRVSIFSESLSPEKVLLCINAYRQPVPLLEQVNKPVPIVEQVNFGAQYVPTDPFSPNSDGMGGFSSIKLCRNHTWFVP